MEYRRCRRCCPRPGCPGRRCVQTRRGAEESGLCPMPSSPVHRLGATRQVRIGVFRAQRGGVRRVAAARCPQMGMAHAAPHVDARDFSSRSAASRAPTILARHPQVWTTGSGGRLRGNTWRLVGGEQRRTRRAGLPRGRFATSCLMKNPRRRELGGGRRGCSGGW